jgi:hypothetical protein
MTVFFAKTTKSYVEFAKEGRFPTFVTYKPNPMKRVLAVLALLVFLASCSQYTCPTYSKKEVKRNNEHKI